MIVVFAIDALEYNLMEEFDCKNLKQKHYGKTDISEFSQPRTIVLWSSFMTGENKEKEVLALGDKQMWSVKWKPEETFFSKFKKPLILDLPGYNYNQEVHNKSRKLLKDYFTTEDQARKKEILKQYNQDAFEHHRNIKEQFLQAINKDYDLVVGYFSVADVLGHLNFGNRTMMRMIYRDLDDIAKQIKQKTDDLLILSDHGMKPVGKFGDHSEYGFWSFKKDLGTPKITDFYHLLERLNP